MLTIDETSVELSTYSNFAVKLNICVVDSKNEKTKILSHKKFLTTNNSTSNLAT